LRIVQLRGIGAEANRDGGPDPSSFRPRGQGHGRAGVAIKVARPVRGAGLPGYPSEASLPFLGKAGLLGFVR